MHECSYKSLIFFECVFCGWCVGPAGGREKRQRILLRNPNYITRQTFSVIPPLHHPKRCLILLQTPQQSDSWHWIAILFRFTINSMCLSVCLCLSGCAPTQTQTQLPFHPHHTDFNFHRNHGPRVVRTHFTCCTYSALLHICLTKVQGPNRRIKKFCKSAVCDHGNSFCLFGLNRHPPTHRPWKWMCEDFYLLVAHKKVEKKQNIWLVNFVWNNVKSVWKVIICILSIFLCIRQVKSSQSFFIEHF